ncbi:MAG: hypothetical protein JWR40_4223 [Massilia sp.]|jgi:hypothetical protein|nr:hypothetical protein [Massilia sp.]
MLIWNVKNALLIAVQLRRTVFHQTIQNFLLAGAQPKRSPAPIAPQQPPALTALIAAIAPSHAAFNARAIEYGHHYRSAFWALYLLSAAAVLSAALPLALGWDDARSSMADFSGIWVVSELLIIALVGLIYWRGHQQDWQGQWLAARTKAELAWYLPLIAPLVDFSAATNAPNCNAPNWYAQLFDPGHHLETGGDIDALCAAHAPLARDALAAAWSNPQFIAGYAHWAADILEARRQYHLHVAVRHHALLHRVHAINTWLFGLTALAALTHLVVHSRLLTLMTIFFPALVASLHGGLAQSEAYRLEATSRRLAAELGRLIAPIRHSLAAPEPLATADAVRTAIQSAVVLILNEHKAWHMLVRPHHLPLG